MKPFRRPSACNFEANSPIWPEVELFQAFMLILIICKFIKDPIKTEGAIVSNIFSGAQGQITPKSMDECGRNSNSFDILWLPGYLQV